MLILTNGDVRIGQAVVQVEGRGGFFSTLEMCDLDPDAIREGAAEADGEACAPQQIAALPDRVAVSRYNQRPLIPLHLHHAEQGYGLRSGQQLPVSVVEFHTISFRNALTTFGSKCFPT